jgi:uncharacterized protein (TIGR02147 family)
MRSGTSRLFASWSLLETPAGPLGHHVVKFHRTMMQLAAASLDHVPREEREIASVTLCLSEEQLGQLKGELQTFRDHLLQKFQAVADSARVVQLNLQMFPLSQGVEER